MNVSTAYLEHQMEVKQRSLLSWALYDWANSSFSAIIQTFIFAIYFTQTLASNPTNGGALWGLLNGVAAIVIAILGPILGAIADHGGSRKSWLGFFTTLCIICTTLLWFVCPNSTTLTYPFFVTFISIIASELAFIFYNAMLPSLAPPNQLGRWSGWGWSFGYVGGMCSLVFSLIILQYGVDVRYTFILCAVWYFLFSLPLFFFTPSTSGKGKPAMQAVHDGIMELLQTLNEVRRYKEIAKFLIARMFYVDGLTTLFAFGGVFAASEFGMNQSEILLFGITLNISAGIGAALFAWVDDWIGPKQLILISLVGMSIPTLWLLLTPSLFLFWTLGISAGVFVGPVQSASRSMMAHLAPKHLQNEMFGFFAFSGKATSFLGPMLVSLLILQFESLRIGLLVVVVFYLIGAAIMTTVKPVSQELS